MCDTPNKFKQATARFLELHTNVASRKKALATAEAKLKKAKELILEAYPDANHDDTFKIDCDGFTINIGKERKHLSLPEDLSPVTEALNYEEAGLGESLMKISYSITDLRANLSDRQLAKLTTPSYGARTVTVKKG